MRLSRFAAVGGLCAILTNILVIAFAGHGYLIATFLAFGPVLLVGYTLHAMYSFDVPFSWVSLARYTITMSANLPIWITLLYTVGLFHLSEYVTVPSTTALAFLWNYLSAKWAFRPAEAGRADLAVRERPE
jgi:putative flippase GtrA